MSRSRQVKDKNQMAKDYIEAMRWQNRERALLPLQNVHQGQPGDRLLYQSLVVRFPDLWIKKLSNILKKFPKDKTKHKGYSKKGLINEIKNYEFQKKQALEKLGNIVYEPVIAIINEQEEEEERIRQQDEDVEMSGGKKRRRKRTRKRRRNNRKKRTKRRKIR